MTDEPLLFVALYDDLMAGRPVHELFGLAQKADLLGPCRIRGRLLTLDDLPALVDGPGEVAGELYRVKRLAVLEELDAYEDADPTGQSETEFERIKVRLIDPDLDAWVYRLRNPESATGQAPSGDWRKR